MFREASADLRGAMTIARIVAIILLLMQLGGMARAIWHGFWGNSWYVLQTVAWAAALIWAVIYPNPTFILLLVLVMAVMYALAFRQHLLEREEREKKDQARARLKAYADANEPGADVIRGILKDSEGR
jgi:hypothetical protein